MFIDFIERLRKKTPSTRQKIAVGISASLTLIIFVLWATVWHFGLDQKKTDSQTMTDLTSTASESQADVGPFSAFVTLFSEGWSTLTNNLKQINVGVSDIAGFDSLNAGTSSVSLSQTASDTTSVSAPDSVKITQ